MATTKGCVYGSRIGFDLIKKDSKRFVGWFTYYGSKVGVLEESLLIVWDRSLAAHEQAIERKSLMYVNRNVIKIC